MAARRSWATAIPWPSSAASAAASSSSRRRSSPSPSMMKSRALRSVADISWATWATTAPAGTSTSPASAWRVSSNSWNRLDLPLPLAPVTPTFQPAARVKEASSNNRRGPRRRLTLRKLSIGWKSWRARGYEMAQGRPDGVRVAARRGGRQALAMAKKNRQRGPCPCGSGRLPEACCDRFLVDGLAAPDPEALMRSRYTAFVRGAGDYLLSTWHPETRPAALEDPALGLKWTG